MQLPLKNRREAGRALAALLDDFRDRDDVQVLALPRGGVPVAYEIAMAQDVDLDVLIVRKLGVPGHEELAMGAIASGGERVMNQEIVLFHQIDQATVDAVVARETQELERREQEYRADRPPPELQGKTVIIVDDGLATGATMRAAIEAVSRQKPAWVVIAVPVAASVTINLLRTVVNECIALATPEPLFAIGQWYQDFAQTTDEEVKRLLADAWSRQGAARVDVLDDDIQLTKVVPEQWTGFCQSFAEDHRGWLVTLGEVDTRQLQEQPDRARHAMRKRADGVPLCKVAYDPGQDALLVEVSEDQQARQVSVDHPVSLYRERVQDSDKGLRIDTESGTSMLVEFHPVPSPAERAGVQR